MHDLTFHAETIVKDKLTNYNFKAEDFNSFQVLLDKLLDIIEGKGNFL